MGHTRPSFILFLVFSNKQYKCQNQFVWKNVHPVYSAEIQTHYLLFTSLLIKPLAQDYHLYLN